MSTHPNAIILAVLTPDNGSRKTERMIFDFCYKNGIKASKENQEISFVNGKKGAISDFYPDGYPLADDWILTVMESDYNESYQLSGKEGQILIHRFITYGYGDKTSFIDVENMKKQLADLLEPMSKEVKFTYEFFITANYW